jgi:hypothetical protein
VEWKWNIIISVLSTGIAAIAVIVSWRGQRESKKIAREIARDQEALTEVREWRQELGIWASEAVDVLSEATYACQAMPKDASPIDYFGPLVRRLRALINRGRFLLPNQQPDHRGNLPKAFLGYRHAALEPLVAAIYVMEENGLENSLKNDVARYRPEVLGELEREFVSNISLILARDLHNVKIANQQIVAQQKARAQRHNELTSYPVGHKLLLSNVVSRVVVERPRGR